MYKRERFMRYAQAAVWAVVLPLVFGLTAGGQSPATAPLQEYIFLIDTSSSMEQNKLVGPLRVALDDYADKIPVDESSRIWIFTFDRGLNREVIDRVLRGTKDLEDAKIFLNTRTYVGDATYIYRALDGVLDRIEKTLSDGKPHDFVVHLFTDGNNNGPGAFRDNVGKFENLRKRSGNALHLYYHGLGVKPEGSTAQLISQTEGMYFVDGITMPPKAQFSPSSETPTDTTPVTFVNRTIGAAERWQWDFGDGGKSSAESPTYVFREPGTYTIRLTASNKAGPSTAAKSISVKGGPPRAQFAVAEPQKPKYIGAPVRFMDKSEGRITAWSWDFGDKQGRSQDRNPQYVFKAAGSFKTVLTVTGPFGKDESSQFVKVSQPEAVAFSFFPDPPKHGQEVKFSNESVGEYKTWRWDFGDGKQSQAHSPTHVFTEAGAFSVTLAGEATDGEKRKTQKMVNVVSAFVQPQARFTLPVANIEIGRSITPADDSKGSIDAWQWTMGDETVLKGRSVQHSFAKAGTYKVSLVVSGPLGKDQAEASLTVTEPDWRIAVSPAPVALGREAAFAIENAPSHLAGVTWDFGDGSAPVQQGRGNLAQHAYKAEGKFAVKATLALQEKAESSRLERVIHAEVAVHGEKVAVRFEARAERAEATTNADGLRKLRGPIPMNVRFEDRSEGLIATRSWDFGDGGRSDDRAPSHEYSAQGLCRVRLTVTDHFGRSHATTESEGLVIETIGWRPPKTWRWPAAVAFFLIVAIFWRFLPRKLRRIAYELDGERQRYRSRNKDLVIVEGENSATFKLCINSWLRKRYLLVPRGAVQWTNAKGEKPDRRYLQARDTVKVGDKAYTIRNMNDSAAAGLRTLGLILVLTALAAWATWPLFF